MHDYCDHCHEEILGSTIVCNTILRTDGKRAILHRKCQARLIAGKEAGKIVYLTGAGDWRNEWIPEPLVPDVRELP